MEKLQHLERVAVRMKRLEIRIRKSSLTRAELAARISPLSLCHSDRELTTEKLSKCDKMETNLAT